MKHLYNICTTSAQRLRRWSNFVQMLCKCFVFAGMVLRGLPNLTSFIGVTPGEWGKNQSKHVYIAAFSLIFYYSDIAL